MINRYASSCTAIVSAALLTTSLPQGALAGQDANFMLYNQHMEEQGAVEVQVFSDYGHVGKGEANYTAQLLEIEYGVTELYSAALYFEGVKTFDDDGQYDFGSFRFENRVRLFANETLFNPVLYAEYEYKKPGSRFVRAVVGRTDGEEDVGGEEVSEHELETKLILGHDITSKLNVAFNTVHEVNFANGKWSFGYVTGLNYALFRAFDSPDSGIGDSGTGLQKVTLGLEFFGGLGDSEEGLTLDGSKTEQYVGTSLRFDLKNEAHIRVGGAFGLTNDSEDAIVRVSAGYEFE